MILLDVCICTIVFLLGLNYRMIFSGFSDVDKRWLVKLFVYHFAIAILFHFYIASSGGDALKYWGLPKALSFNEVLGMVLDRKASSFVYFFNFFPANTLQLSLFTGNMLYSLIGFTGFIYLYRTIKELMPDHELLYNLKLFGIRLFPLIFFLPNLHFWSSGIGKDAILFLCINMFVFALVQIRRRIPLLLFSIVLSFLIRPHITLFLIASLGIGFFIDGNLKPYQKVLIILLVGIGIFSVLDYMLRFIQIENFELSTIEQFADKRVSDLGKARTESRVDMSSYPFPFKVFTFLYRPLFIDGNGLFGILASFENLILLLFTFFVFRNKPFKALKKSHYIIKGGLIFFVMGAVMFSLILGNLGIMLRQKNMLFPLFILFGIWVLYWNKQRIISAYEGLASNK